MHTDTRQLLALIDGEPIDAAQREHALGCAACQSEIDRLQRMRARLRALPEIAPPALSTAVLTCTAVRPRWPRRVAAAGLVLAVMLAALVTTQRAVEPPLIVLATGKPQQIPERIASDLTARSAQLEREWRALSGRAGAVTRVGHEFGTARIKTRLLQLDAQFAAGDNQQYWNQRVQLLDSLVDIERAELLAQDDRAYQVVRASQRQR